MPIRLFRLSRQKNADFEIVEELRTWRGNSIRLEGQSLQGVLDDLQRWEIDVQITLSFDRKRASGASTTRTSRSVGVRNDDSVEYHLYITSLPQEEFLPADLATIYRCRW